MNRVVRVRGGAELPVLGQGTWMMGESYRRRMDEVAALKLGIDLGMTLIDSAEMYADGGAEKVVAEAIKGCREEVFLVSKVLPYNASREGTIRAAEGSLERLRTDYLDLYLLHWSGSYALTQTYEAFEQLVEQGKIRHFGVSNFDLDDMQASEALPSGGKVGVNQVLYNLQRRGIERQLHPWCAERGIGIMAYSPLEQGHMPQKEALSGVAERHGVTRYQIALAWALRLPQVVVIPKAANVEHVRQNAAAAELDLTQEDLAELDAAFPPPDRDVPLETL